jgi:cation transport regulator ChaC
MTLYFAYGSNMSRGLMRRLCPTAKEVGTAVLEGHRFVITADGFASVERHAGGVVHGVLWRLTSRDFSALNIYESVGTGLYHCRRLPVRHVRRQYNAFVYVARPRGPGKPRPGYLELVIAAARDWNLPQPYIDELARWSCSGLNAARSVDGGEIR